MVSQTNIELIGGEITLKSKKGEGSTFFITIPYKPTSLGLENSNSAAKIEEEEEEEEEEHRCTILVAEDEEINYLFLEILLKKEIDLDCIIIHAKNGEEAVEICDKNPDIDLILMDLKMPVMDALRLQDRSRNCVQMCQSWPKPLFHQPKIKGKFFH